MRFAGVYLAITIIGCGGAAAQQPAKLFDAGAYPPAFAPDMVRKFDLTGSGRGDYTIDFRDAECGDLANFYCGTGGCQLDIGVTLPDGQVRPIFSNQVLYYEILPGRGARTIHFELHGSFCGLHGGQLCVKTHRITTAPFKFTMPQ
jgi:hypothetical protein